MTRSKARDTSELLHGLGARIRAARELLGWTQQMAAQRLHMSVEGYARVERGSVSPSLETFALICVEMAISPDDLLSVPKPAKSPPALPPEQTDVIRRITARLPSLGGPALRFVDHAVRFASLQVSDANTDDTE